MSKAIVSILIPFKNTARYLPACLDSIQAQDFKEWEVLAVDDHSDDNSAAIVQDYADKDPRISCLKNQGFGIIHALRTAFAQSSGAFITRMDSDDIMTTDKIRVLYDGLMHHGPGHLSTGQVKYFSEKGIGEGYARYETWLNELISLGSNYSEIYKECVIPSPCWMVHKEDLEMCEGFSPERYPEDYDLAFRFYQKGLKVIPCSKVLHYWRDYPTRTSRTSEHYALNHFLEIKIHYFLKIDRDPGRPLVVWGAGGKGKVIAKLLLHLNCEFIWLCDNPNKIGKKIYGVPLESYQILSTLKNPQSVITVANEVAQAEIRTFLKKQDMKPVIDFLFFC